MVIEVTLGEPMWRDVGARHITLDFSNGSRNLTVSLFQLASRLDMNLFDAEGALLVIVNGQIIPLEETSGLRLNDKDHVEFHMMLTGG